MFPLDSGTDYRRIPRALAKVYYHPLDEETKREIDKLWESMTSHDDNDPIVRNRSITSWGRTMTVPQSTSKMARFTFLQLCGDRSPMGASDYIEITQTFQTIFITDIPRLDMNSKDHVSLVGACVSSSLMNFHRRDGLSP